MSCVDPGGDEEMAERSGAWTGSMRETHDVGEPSCFSSEAGSPDAARPDTSRESHTKDISTKQVLVK